MSPRTKVARDLAAALLAGDWTRDELVRNAQQVLGRRAPKSLLRVVDDVLEQSVTPYPPSPGRLARLILASPAFDRAAGAARKRGSSGSTLLAQPEFSPLPRLRNASIQNLASPRDLAAWLEISLPHLDWFADERRQHGFVEEPALQHYTHVWLPKRTGPPRLIEAPKARLKQIQRQILRGVLDHVPTHDAAHGFVKGRSCLSAAAPHGGERVVVAVDLKDFFLNTSLPRAHGVFRSVGYPWPVARLLTGLCSTATPNIVLERLPGRARPDWATRDQYRSPHLPQGAPTSPALANLCAWRLDCRLSGLARHLNARYTRYADDLVFSGDDDLARKIESFLGIVEVIAKEEGFTLNGGKTRVMRRSGRQSVTGLVVNQHVNVSRASYDTLKATLHNCVRKGPQSQNHDDHADFRAHLNGRVTWVENVNPRRGLKLRRIFEKIDWEKDAGA